MSWCLVCLTLLLVLFKPSAQVLLLLALGDKSKPLENDRSWQRASKGLLSLQTLDVILVVHFEVPQFPPPKPNSFMVYSSLLSLTKTKLTFMGLDCISKDNHEPTKRFKFNH